MEVKYDLIIAGGGPAGCAAAITAARGGARVLLLERGRYPRHKVCGEFISPEAVAVLSSLLLPADSERLVLAGPKVGAMRIFVDGRTIQAPVRPSAIGVRRYDLDLALWRACKSAGVDAREGVTVNAIEHTRVVTSHGEMFNTRASVDTTGRWSNLRHQHHKDKSPQFIGLKGHFVEADAPLSADLYFFPGGYCGVQPIGEDLVNVCAMVRADLTAKLDDVFQLEPRLQKRAAGWTPATTPVSTFPLIFRELSPLHAGVVCAGDAAGFIDPFVGDGISLALQTGVAAAQALASVWRDGNSLQVAAEAYRSHYERRFRPIFRRAARVRRLFSLPRPLRAVAATIAQMPGVSSGLLKITRAA